MKASLLNVLGQIDPVLERLNGLSLIVFLAVLGLTTLFVLGYLSKGSQVWWQLFFTARRLRALRRVGKGPKPADAAAAFRGEPLRHLWDEYADTLHEVKRASSGGLSLTDVRATVPAETFFTRDVLVDGRLFDDFTRHLPGVLTGLGIIGTFAGLLEGLKPFNATSAASAVAGLTPLIEGVKHAFIASSVAIACAMGVTFVSRLVLAYFYRLVEQLNQAIDALYSTGAGEEYLSRLVHASEKNEAHTAQLKEAMVEDLTKLMTNLVERQVQAHAESIRWQVERQAEATHRLGEHIGQTLLGTLAEPIRRMTDAMEQTSRGNNEAVSGMLESMLAGFMAKLEDTFGGQMRSIQEQMQGSMNAMTAVQQSLQKLLADIASTNEQAANRMSGKLEDAMKQAAANQSMLIDQMREFVTEFRKLVGEEQNKSRQAMDGSVSAVLEKVTRAVEQLEAVRKTASVEEQARSERLAAETHQLVTGLSGQMREFAGEFRQLVAEERIRSREVMDGAVANVLGNVTQAVGQLETVRQSAALEEQSRSERLAAETQQLFAALGQQMREFTSDFRQVVAEERSKSREAIDGAMDSVFGGVSQAVGALETVRANAASEEQARSERLASQAQQLVAGLAGQVDTLVRAVSDQVRQTQRNIDALGSVSLRAIDGMNQGALTMGSAAQRFEAAGNTVSDVFDRSAQVTDQLAATAGTLQVVAGAVRQGFEQYDSRAWLWIHKWPRSPALSRRLRRKRAYRRRSSRTLSASSSSCA